MNAIKYISLINKFDINGITSIKLFSFNVKLPVGTVDFLYQERS